MWHQWGWQLLLLITVLAAGIGMLLLMPSSLQQDFLLRLLKLVSHLSEPAHDRIRFSTALTLQMATSHCCDRPTRVILGTQQVMNREQYRVEVNQSTNSDDRISKQKIEAATNRQRSNHDAEAWAKQQSPKHWHIDWLLLPFSGTSEWIRISYEKNKIKSNNFMSIVQTQYTVTA